MSIVKSRLGAVVGALLSVALVPALRAEDKEPIQGPEQHGGAGSNTAPDLDKIVLRFMEDRGVPGAAFAVLDGKRLVHLRTFGVTEDRKAPKDSKHAVTPKTLFRLASLTKSFTGAAIAKLVDEKKIHLGETIKKAADLNFPDELKQIFPDDKYKAATVGMLVHHTSGYDGSIYDPMFDQANIAAALKLARPVGDDAIIKYMFTKQGMATPPGQTFAYANFNYVLLGKLMEHVTKMSYEDYVKKEIQEPLGIKHMRLGKTLERAPDETHYFMPPRASADVPSAFATGPQMVPWPYGGFAIEPMAPHGGWLATIVDIARWAAALDPDKPAAPWVETMYKGDGQPGATVNPNNGITVQYGYGIFAFVETKGGKPVGFNHSGSLPGTFTAFSRISTGAAWVLLCNQRSDEDKKLPADGDIFKQLDTACAAVKEWPKEDFFSEYHD